MPLRVDPRLTKGDGFHAGVGLGVFGFFFLAYVAQATVQAHFDWKWGLLGARLSPTLRGTLVGVASATPWSDRFFSATVDGQFHLNLGRVFALGVGVEIGTLVTPGAAAGRTWHFVVGPSLSPAILRLGDRGQHQLALAGSRLFVWPSTLDSYPFSPKPGELNAGFSYSYFF